MRRLLSATLSFIGLAVQATVTPLPGVTPQRAPAQSDFPVAVAVRVTDAQGQPVPNVRAYYSSDIGYARVSSTSPACWIDYMILQSCVAMTDSDGVARFPPIYARYAATFTARVQATNDRYPDAVRYGETQLEFVADPRQAPARLVVASGNDQSAVIGSALAPISVRLEEPDGRPRRQAKVWYGPLSTAGGFEMPQAGGNAEVWTDDQGVAALPRFTAGWGVGAHQAYVRYFDDLAAAYVEAPIRYTATNAQGGSTLSLGDLWWGGPAESGWGVSVFQHEDRLFNVWFVYGDDGRPTWYVQSTGTWSEGLGGFFNGAVYSPRGSAWSAYDASRFAVGPPVGQGSFNFQGPDAGWSNFFSTNGQWNESFSKAIVRQSFGEGAQAPIQGVGDLWWGGPSQNGWGLAIHEQAGTLFMVWFTYRDDGKPTWMVMPGGRWTSDGAYSGTVYRTQAVGSTSGMFTSSSVKVVPVGTFTLRFASTSRATMELRVDGTLVVLDLVRQPF